MSTAVVIGGGIAGLTAARQLSLAGFSSVTVLEAGARLGGKVAALELDGVRLDCGAESVLARRPEAMELIKDLGLEGAVVHPTAAKAQVFVDRRIQGLPGSAMGIPNDLDRLDGYLTPAGLARASQEPSLPAPALTGDVGIGAYVAERFGDEVTDRLLEPLLGGVYAGHSRELSFAAVAPALFERARGGGSLLEHARSLPASTATGPVFAGLVGGVNGLVTALLRDLENRQVRVRTGVTVRELRAVGNPTSGGDGGDGRYELVCGPVPYPEVIMADAVVVAVPAKPAGLLLTELLGAPAVTFAATPYASMAVITLVVRDAELQGSGLLVPPGELPTVKALTYSSQKWDWVGDAAAEAWGPGTAVVRASVGRFGQAEVLQIADEALIERTFAEIRAAVPGWRESRLLASSVQRWGGGLPQYLVGHPERVAQVRSTVANHPGLAICGAALEGVGIAACVAGANQAVEQVTASSKSTGKINSKINNSKINSEGEPA